MPQITFPWFAEGETVPDLVRRLGGYFEIAGEALRDMDRPILLLLLLLPPLLALVSRRVPAILATTGLSASALVLVAETAQVGIVTGLILAFLSLLVGILAVAQRRKGRLIKEELEDLRTRIGRLESAEERRWLSQIKAVEQDK